MLTPGQLVEAQLAAYNAHDIDAFAACYADDVELREQDGTVVASGIDALRLRYLTLWRDPARRACSVGRIVQGSVVIEYEHVVVGTAAGVRTLEAVLIFRVLRGRIARVTFIDPTA